MKQEPVAWGMYSLKTKQFTGITNIPRYGEEERMCIPLYTAPKELSDEEIKAIDNSVKYSELALSHDEYMNKFARAILKKAREK